MKASWWTKLSMVQNPTYVFFDTQFIQSTRIVKTKPADGPSSAWLLQKWTFPFLGTQSFKALKDWEWKPADGPSSAWLFQNPTHVFLGTHSIRGIHVVPMKTSSLTKLSMAISKSSIFVGTKLIRCLVIHFEFSFALPLAKSWLL